MRDVSTLKPIGSAHCPQYNTSARRTVPNTIQKQSSILMQRINLGSGTWSCATTREVTTVLRSLSLAFLMIGARKMLST
jgi:hypothetical protein